MKQYFIYINRKKTLFFFLVMLMCSIASSQKLSAQVSIVQDIDPVLRNRILLIYDASNSMNGRWQSDSKMVISKKLMMNILDTLNRIKNLELALRVYGHQSQFPPLDCKDTRLEVPFAPDNTRQIAEKIKSLIPRGSTPIAYSLEQAANDFPPCNNCRNIIILITDGLEECGGDPCAASVFLQSKGISLRPFVIGIGEDFKNAFDCVGEYFDASMETEFVKAFDVVISQALNSTTAQVNLLDAQGAPTETNVTMSFYDQASGILQKNYVHTMNVRGLSDTISLEPLLTYSMVVHSIPPVKVDNIHLKAGIHNIIAADVPQGQLMVKSSGSRVSLSKNTPCIVRKRGSSEILHVLSINEQERFLKGFYDLEILCLPRLKIDNVEVKQSSLTTVDIPMPGVLVVQRGVEGYAGIYSETPQGLELIYTIPLNSKSETLYLLPGKYRVVNRSRYHQRAAATREKSVLIESGVSSSISF